MAFTIHFGVDRSEVEDLCTALIDYPAVVTTYRDGDGWEVWGERIGTDDNDDTTAHVTARVTDPGAAIDVAISITDDLDSLLVPSERGGTPGCIAVVTAADDWDVQIAHIYSDDRITVGRSQWDRGARYTPVDITAYL